MEPLFSGIATALVTPFNQRGHIDYPTFEKLINRQITAGINALVILGTTGELSTLSHSERQQIIKFTLKTVQGRIPVIFGIGGNNPATIIKLGQFIKQAIQNYQFPVGVMISAPYYNKTTPDGMVTWFRTLTNAIKLPTIVYNVPSRTGVNITPLTMRKIAYLPYVVGIKEASGNLTQIAHVVQLCPNTAVYSGDDTLCLPSFAVGCCGLISVASNNEIVPLQKIYQNFNAGNITAAREIYLQQLDYFESLFRAVNPIPIKCELAKRGLLINALRLPLVPIE